MRFLGFSVKRRPKERKRRKAISWSSVEGQDQSNMSQDSRLRIMQLASKEKGKKKRLGEIR